MWVKILGFEREKKERKDMILEDPKINKRKLEWSCDEVSENQWQVIYCRLPTILMEKGPTSASVLKPWATYINVDK